MDRKNSAAFVGQSSQLPSLSPPSFATPSDKHIQIDSKASVHFPWICKPETGSINIQFI